MNEIIRWLQQSMEDEMFSGAERKSLRQLIQEVAPDADELNVLRNKVFEMAAAKATTVNYSFVVEWLRVATSALMTTIPADKAKAYFSPGEECREEIIRLIQSAAQSLKICVFTISDDRISSAILASHQNGVDVKILTDNDKLYDVGSDITRLTREGLHVRIDNTANHMHHKFMIADNRHLLTGSYNWTNSAARYNHENILVTADPDLVRAFLHEFDNLWQKMGVYELNNR